MPTLLKHISLSTGNTETVNVPYESEISQLKTIEQVDTVRLDKITVTDDGTAIIKTSIAVTPKFDIGKGHHVTADLVRSKGKDEATMNCT